MPIKYLKPSFVDAFPEKLDEGVLYVALEYATMSHLCACGCGSEVITPLSPKDWEFTYNGDSISVKPSIGSWSLECESHYVIQNGAIRWAEKWDSATIQAGRERDLERKRGATAAPPPPLTAISSTSTAPPHAHRKRQTLWEKIKQGLGID
jgi:hypothetical protein